MTFQKFYLLGTLLANRPVVALDLLYESKLISNQKLNNKLNIFYLPLMICSTTPS